MAITRPETVIIAPFRMSNIPTVTLSFLIHFLFIRIRDVENKQIDPNKLPERIIEVKIMDDSGEGRFCLSMLPLRICCC
jgi:hypothetical protein